MVNKSVTLTIGGILIHIKSPNTTFINDVSHHYRNFQTIPYSNKKTLSVSITHKNLPSRDDILVNLKNNIYTIDGGEFYGTLDTSTNICNVIMKAEKSVLDSFLRVLYSIVLTKEEAFLIHSAGLAKDNKAYLFTGKSESGKTTTARCADEFDVLNDELTLVRYTQGQFYLYATPFVGDYDGEILNIKAPLQYIFFLNKKLEDKFTFIEKEKALIKLLENIFFFDSNVDSNQKMLNICHKLISNIEAYDINIYARDSLWRLVNDIEKHCSFA